MRESEFLILRDSIESGRADKAVYEALKPYRVDNAIIMAAGYSARCMPLSNVMPKGLFKVKGEVLIEREIQQLLEAGISEIVEIGRASCRERV